MVRVGSEPVCQLRRVQTPHVAIIGLLIAAIFVGSIDVAIRAYFAIGTQPQPEKVGSVKIQDRLIAVVADSQRALQTSTSPGVVKPLQTSDPSASNPGSDVTEGSASATSTQRTVLLQPMQRALHLQPTRMHP